MRVGFLLPLLFLGTSSASIAVAQSPGTFTPTGNMSTPRGWGLTATLLLNGKVLIAGSGNFPDSALASAELYDPSTGVFTPTGNMTTPRTRHKATLLADGRVLIVGGYVKSPPPANLSFSLTSAELYDPSTGAFTATGAMTTDATFDLGAATLLSDGRVLVTGCTIPCNSGIAELYDPGTGTFASAGTSGTAGYTATLLAGGRVLTTAGCHPKGYAIAQIFDPGTGRFSFTGPMTTGCGNVNTATLLMNGRVLVAGSSEYPFPADAELYDPAAGTFANLGHAIGPHEFSAATLLSDGTVLIAGGQLPGGSASAGAELYDPVSGKFVVTANMVSTRFGQTATLLPDGRVLMAGGETGLHPYTSPSDVYQPTMTASAELYTPNVRLASSALLSVSGDGRGQGAILHATTQQLVSSTNPAVAGEALEVYGTGLIDGSVIPPQLAIGGRMAEVLYFGKAPGFAGLNQVNVRVPSGVVPGSAVPVRLTYLSRPSNEVTIGLR